jgi:hypothetical protein
MEVTETAEMVEMEGILIFQNTCRGDIGGMELCQREQRWCGTVSEGIEMVREHVRGDIDP